MTTKEKNELEFEVLSDHNNLVAKELGLVFSLAEELRPIYLSFNMISYTAHSSFRPLQFLRLHKRLRCFLIWYVEYQHYSMTEFVIDLM